MRPKSSESRTCARCVLDETIADIRFDAAGVCSWCEYLDARPVTLAPDVATQDRQFRQVIQQIKDTGRRSRYDCVLGVSGGIDSSYAALVAVRAGLRPLVVHVDNGWNTEIAVRNIESIVRGLNLDLITHVIDWQEFRSLQLSLLRAGVVDLEMLSDHAIIATMFHAARRHRIKYIVTGDNDATEAGLPKGWNHRKTDLVNIRAINRAFERTTMKTFPSLSTLEMLAHRRLLGTRYVGLLSYVEYVKEKAIGELERELGWKRYGKKHFESVITRFYQGYILPTKFGIDKRKFHYALMIHSRQMTRDEALAELKSPPYDPKLQEQDKVYVSKKLGITVGEFDRMMNERPVPHEAYANDGALVERLLKVSRGVRRVRSALGA